MSEILAVDGEFQLYSVRLHLAAAGGASANFQIQLDSGEGSEHDWVIGDATTDMNAVTTAEYLPTRPQPFRPDDRLLFTWSNTNGKAWGLEIIYQPI